jgi:hypothetical protein
MFPIGGPWENLRSKKARFEYIASIVLKP